MLAYIFYKLMKEATWLRMLANLKILLASFRIMGGFVSSLRSLAMGIMRLVIFVSLGITASIIWHIGEVIPSLQHLEWEPLVY